MHKEAKRRIKKAFEEAYDIGIIEIERLAREILMKHQNLDEFIMGMGAVIFTIKNEDISIDPWNRKYMHKLAKFLDEWNSTFHFTGDPMRFTAAGKKITDWGAEK